MCIFSEDKKQKAVSNVLLGGVQLKMLTDLQTILQRFLTNNLLVCMYLYSAFIINYYVNVLPFE